MLKLSIENQALLQHFKNLHATGELFGMFENVPKEVYHHPECPGVSKTNLDIVDESYSDYLAYLEAGKEEIKEIDFRDKFFKGHAYHLITLEPDLFYQTFCVALVPPEEPKLDKRTTVGKTAYAEWVNSVMTHWEKETYSAWFAENGDKVILPLGLWTELHEMKASCESHSKIKFILDSTMKEVTFFGKDEKTGLTIKCQVDALSIKHRFVCDFKSTFDASPKSFRKSISKFMYDKQAAFYLYIIKQVLGGEWIWLFVASRKKSSLSDNRPVLSQPYRLDQPSIDVGEQLYRRSLDKIAGCHRGDVSHGYSDDILDISLPAFGFDVEAR